MWCVTIVMSFAFVAAQDADRSADDEVVSAGSDVVAKQLDELEAIEFAGNQIVTDEEMLGVIESRESEISITRRLALYYWENFKVNPSTPAAIMRTLTDIQEELANELRYFNEATAREDSASLLVYLDQNGFHNASVAWKFGYDRDSRKNTLLFKITERQRATIDTIIYVGLDSLPASIYDRVWRSRTIREGDGFSEADIESSVRNMISTLANNGYFKARYETPRVFISADGLHDSVLVKIYPGKRVRIGKVEFVENANGFPSVNESTRKRQLEFKEGEWFSRRELNRSRANLVQLGVFEVVSVDTFRVDSTLQRTDSLVTIRVFTKNNKNYDVGANLLLFQTAIDNFLNAGAGVTAQYRNVFGGAQVASATFQYIFQDVSSWFQGQNLQSEVLASLVFAWPNIARYEGLRIGLNTNMYYSLRLLADPFRLESFGFGARVPVDLYSYTYFNGFDFTVGLERQRPLNYIDALDSALNNAVNGNDTAFVLSTFNQFLVLDQYLQTSGNFFTGIYSGINLRGEHRDKPDRSYDRKLCCDLSRDRLGCR